ncbi:MULTISPECIES: LacI family DNA-binding transcriptional regulator [Alteromonadaceae]|uniref:LacI family DNA-binding transcriptional regulator n=1 Tax=Alteromonadaceae TaxID=72275 RepID=UPI001C0862CF|nr:MULTISPECIES: LacI family DNA-binding transcriptional regulator [Aliiglaciecola]MBU2879293.1 LacI family transcriptional regulator [Aliiglaciecola lipolytica]MDO6709745.1 LacI family DNA-binding transcriptional regulator [Aliiglaciecola sp. 2_MG-2023]MDO6750713.1 LacI family DNA-binding transcriptional regulator [Aliiglaciecola sp. 1_MG-2023]
MAKVKLIDVARFAGVSKSTASQYLNGRFDYMSKETQERIRAAIAELDYVPNPIARNLKATKTKTIGVVVRDITGFYTSRVIRGVDDYCKANGYNALIYNTDFDPEIEAKSIEALYQLRVDGIIIASSGNNNQLVTDYIGKGMPIVHFQIENDGSEQNIVLSDYKKAAFDATEYLIQLGHKKICFVTQDFKNVISRTERYQGYADALTKHGIPVEDSLVQFWQRESGFQVEPTEIIKSAAPTAFFTQHLPITIELLRDLNQANISVPDDVSLLGFDEIPMAEFFKVPITVVKQEPYTIGMEATQLLLNNIANESNLSHKILIPCSLELRESCKAI